MFGIIRLALGLIMWLFATKSKHIRQATKPRYYVTRALTVIVLITVLSLFPIENALLTFQSPETVYKYYNLGAPEIVLVVEGDHSDLVVGERNGTNTHLIVPKSAEGWKIGAVGTTKRELIKVIDGACVYMYHSKTKGDCFIVVVDTNGRKLEITDSTNSHFRELVRDNHALDKQFWSYYAYVPNFNSNYWLAVNGETV